MFRSAQSLQNPPPPKHTHTHTHTLFIFHSFWQMGIPSPGLPSLLLAWPGSKGLLSYLPPPIVCDSWKPQSSFKLLHIQPLLLLLLHSPFSFSFHSLFHSLLPLFLFLRPLHSHVLTGLRQPATCTHRAVPVQAPGDRRNPSTDYQKYSLWFTQCLLYFKIYFITFMIGN